MDQLMHFHQLQVVHEPALPDQFMHLGQLRVVHEPAARVQHMHLGQLGRPRLTPAEPRKWDSAN